MHSGSILRTSEIVAVRLLLTKGEPAVARERSRKLVETEPGDAEAHHLLGVSELLLGNLEESIAHLLQAVALNQNVAQYQCNLGEAYRRSGAMEKAAASFERALDLQPEYPDASYNLACTLFSQGDYKTALKQFSLLIKKNPENPKYLTGRADSLRESGRIREAIGAYFLALKADPGWAAAHANLAPLLLQTGRADEALDHCRKAVELAPEDGVGYQNLGRCLVELEQLDEAMDAYADAFERMPSSPDLGAGIGKVWLEVGDLQQAAFWFNKALDLDEGYIPALCGRAAIQRESGMPDLAAAELKKLADSNPDNLDVLLALGQSMWDDGDAEGALEHFRRAAELRPELAHLHSRIGSVLASAGAVDEAMAEHKKALDQNPRCIPALNGLATTLRGKLEPETVKRLKRLLKNRKLREGALSLLHNGLAYYYDGCKRFKQAAEHATEANRLYWIHRTRRGWEYSAEEYEKHVSRIIEIFDAGFFRRTAGFGLENETPAFVVGMPRSGTSLTEQILSSHPRVLGIGERDFATRALGRLVVKTGERRDPYELLPDIITSKGVQRVARSYLAQLETQKEKAGAKQALRVIDKMPDNYSLLGWILTLFPKARIFHCRRDVRDIGLSCWLTQFRQIRWACSLEHIAERIRQYERLMAHWREVLPVPVFEVDYEQLVEDQEGVTRRMLEWLGVEWHPDCLKFYDTERLVRTASVTQVRQPIYKRSVARWKSYETALEPLIQRLG